MKKLTIALIVIAVIFSFSGCGSSGSPSSDGNTEIIQFTLSWDEPTQRENLTLLVPGDITNYRVYYGTSASVLSDFLEIDSGIYSTSFSGEIVIPDSSITYYFAMTSVDKDGIESRKSDVISY